MGLIVQKYGGTSVADLERIRNVANQIAKTYDQGHNPVVILSAMAGVTDGLISKANEISKTPDKRELDVLLATGEQTTAALMAMTPVGRRVTFDVLIARKRAMASVAVPGLELSVFNSFMALMPKGVAALPRPRPLAAIFRIMAPMAE